MDDLNSTNLQLVLGVKEGSNFDRVQKPTVIIAILNGNCQETKKIPPVCDPQYSSDLIWEIDRNALRKMRSNSTPIKVEVYAINENGSREKLGYILISVRCAQIIAKDQEQDIRSNWHNILGVKSEFHTCKPKLLLYLIIRESKGFTTLKEDLPQSIVAQSYSKPVWMQEERLIQLGPLENSQDIFLLSITAEYAANLNQIILALKENGNNNFILIYTILDTCMKLKSFRIDSDKTILNETVVIKIRTSLPILMNFLYSKSHFFIKLKNKNDVVGQSEVDLRPLVTTTTVQEFKQKNKNATSTLDHCCILKNVSNKEGAQLDKLPILKIHVKLQYMELKETQLNLFNDNNTSFCSVPKLAKSNTFTLSNQNYTQEQINHLSHLENNYKISNFPTSEKAVHYTQNSEIPNSANMKHNLISLKEHKFINGNVHNNYCLNICMGTIKFFDSKPDVENIEFRFYHSQIDVLNTVNNKISIVANEVVELQDVKCKMYFISSTEGIEHFLKTFALKVNICDATNEEKKCIAHLSFDINKLIDQKKRKYNYEASLVDCHNHKEIGSANVVLELLIIENENSSVYYKPREEILDFNKHFKTTLDNDLAYKIVEELETWKERQKEIFKDELKKKEESYLNLLSEEWLRCRNYLESQLANNIQKCKILVHNLNESSENLRARKIQSFEKERKLINENEELQAKYDRKLRQLQDALQKMQDEFSLKLKNLEEQNRNLLSEIECLNDKKYELEKIKFEQAEKLQTYKKVSLTEDQTTSVLQQLKNLEQKLDSAQKSKTFFKEEWSKAVKEIHRIKMENQQAIDSQIKNSKEELNQIDLEGILHADSTALTYDQIVLNQIQREIDIINPESTMQYLKASIKDEEFNSQSEVYIHSYRNHEKSDSSINSSEIDRKLHMLIEKRDSLLESRNYTNEDDTIIKLNAEIRSILMNS